MGEIHNTTMVNGHRIHYRDEGRNNLKTIVLLHGFMQNRSVWDELTLQLMHDYRVISIDLPGHGYSETFSDIHTMEFMATCVHETLSTIGVGASVIIGHSMGGYVTLAYARQFGLSTKGIGLIHAHAMADDAEHIRMRDQVCERVNINAASYIVDFVPSLFAKSNEQRLIFEINNLKDECLNTSKESIIAAQQGMKRRHNAINMLTTYPNPVLFIYGKQDRRIPLEVALSDASLPQYSQMVLLENAGHMAHIECPKIVKRSIANFVDSCYAQEEYR